MTAIELYRIWRCSDLKRSGSKCTLAQSREIANQEWEQLPDERRREFEEYSELTGLFANSNRQAARAKAKAKADAAKKTEEAKAATPLALQGEAPLEERGQAETVRNAASSTEVVPSQQWVAGGRNDDSLTRQLELEQSRGERLPLSSKWYQHYMKGDGSDGGRKTLKANAEEFAEECKHVAVTSSRLKDVTYPKACGAVCCEAGDAIASCKRYLIEQLLKYRRKVEPSAAKLPEHELLLAFEVFDVGRPKGVFFYWARARSGLVPYIRISR